MARVDSARYRRIAFLKCGPGSKDPARGLFQGPPLAKHRLAAGHHLPPVPTCDSRNYREGWLRRDAVRAASKGNTPRRLSSGRNFSVQLPSLSYPACHEVYICMGKCPDLERLHGTA
jgi:hypothetical protein